MDEGAALCVKGDRVYVSSVKGSEETFDPSSASPKIFNGVFNPQLGSVSLGAGQGVNVIDCNRTDHNVVIGGSMTGYRGNASPGLAAFDDDAGDFVK